jgi:predicted HAD superfamily Cof-like phosphohydrolase
MLRRVFDFNQNVLGIDSKLPFPMEPVEKKWLVGCINEEASELEEAYTLVDQIDALVDTIIFAAGGLYRLGLSVEKAEACISAVMDANFEKKAGQKPGRIYEGVIDAVKPAGWVGPEARIQAILESKSQ